MGGGPGLTVAQWARPEVLFAFIDELRGLGFNLGTAHYAAAQDLLLAIVAEPRTTAAAAPSSWRLNGDGGPERLERLLGPLLCSTPREQQDLPRLLATWGAGPGRLLADSLAARDRAAAGEPGQEPESGAGSRLPPPAAVPPERPLEAALHRIERVARVWSVPAVVLALIVGLGALRYYLTLQDLPPRPMKPPPGVPAAAPGWPAWWLLAAAGAIAGGYLCWRLWLSLLGRQFLVRRPAVGAPALAQLSVRAATDDLFAPHALRRSAEQLRRRVARPGSEIDLEATVERTVRQGGWPTPVAGRRLVRPEYLVLIERASPGDQRSRFVDELGERLTQQGVVLERAYFEGDPRTCFRTSRRAAGAGSPTAAGAGAAILPPAASQPAAGNLANPLAAAAEPSRPEGAGAAAGTAAAPLGLRDLYSLYPEHRLLQVSAGWRARRGPATA
jgi:hypothetical protein